MTKLSYRSSKRQRVEKINEMLSSASPAYTVVTVLPASLPVGTQVLFNGTMYRGLLAGESSLPAGTPWPVKGYQEFMGIITLSPVTLLTTVFNDFDFPFVVEHPGAGQFRLAKLDLSSLITHPTNFNLSVFVSVNNATEAFTHYWFMHTSGLQIGKLEINLKNSDGMNGPSVFHVHVRNNLLFSAL